MKSHTRLLVLLFASISSACTEKPIPSERAYRSFKQIQGAIGVGVSKLRYDELLQDAAAEVLILSDISKSSNDTSVVKRYAAALDKYKDAETIWAEKIDDARYDWLPKGRIYVTRPDIVTKYKLSTQNHTMPYSGQKYETIPEESVQLIWSAAEEDIQAADSLIVPRLRK